MVKLRKALQHIKATYCYRRGNFSSSRIFFQERDPRNKAFFGRNNIQKKKEMVYLTIQEGYHQHQQ